MENVLTMDIRTDDELQAMSEQELHDYLQKTDEGFQVVLAYKQKVHDTWQQKLADRLAANKIANMSDHERAALARAIGPEGFSARKLP